MRDHRGKPFLLPLRGFISPPFQFILDFHKTTAIQIHVEDQPDGLGLLRIDVEFHQLGLVRQQFLISIISQNIAVAVIDTVIHRCLLTALDTDGGLAAFILGKCGHDGEPKLTIAVKGFDAIVDEVDLYSMFFQHPGVLQGVHGVSSKPGHLTGQNQVKLVLFRILHHPHEFGPLLCGCSGDALIHIPLHQSPFRVKIQQRFVPVQLILQCGYLRLMLRGNTGVDHHFPLEIFHGIGNHAASSFSSKIANFERSTTSA